MTTHIDSHDSPITPTNQQILRTIADCLIALSDPASNQAIGHITDAINNLAVDMLTTLVGVERSLRSIDRSLIMLHDSVGLPTQSIIVGELKHITAAITDSRISRNTDPTDDY